MASQFFRTDLAHVCCSGRVLLGARWERNEEERKMAKALEKVAQEVGAKHITSGAYQLARIEDVSLI